MTTWNFQLRLNREPTEDEFDELFEAGLTDVGIEGTLVDVDREAPSLLHALTGVVEQIRTVPGLRAVGVVNQDAVTLSDAAQRLGRRTAESLRLLASGERGPGGFPSPLADTGKVRVYSWSEITTWLREALGEDVPVENAELALADRILRLVDQAHRAGKAQLEAVQHLVGTC
jgi:parvulin-like peptidyl-prolyl isomerase